MHPCAIMRAGAIIPPDSVSGAWAEGSLDDVKGRGSHASGEAHARASATSVLRSRHTYICARSSCAAGSLCSRCVMIKSFLVDGGEVRRANAGVPE